MIAEANPDRVRNATEEDQDALLDLCRRSHEETGIGPFSALKTLAAIDGALRHGVGVVGVVGDGSVVAAGTILRVYLSNTSLLNLSIIFSGE